MVANVVIPSSTSTEQVIVCFSVSLLVRGYLGLLLCTVTSRLNNSKPY